MVLNLSSVVPVDWLTPRVPYSVDFFLIIMIYDKTKTLTLFHSATPTYIYAGIIL